MRTIVLLGCALLVACGDGGAAERQAALAAQKAEEDRLAAEQAERERQARLAEEARIASENCMRNAFNNTVVNSYTDVQLVSAADLQDLTDCPKDFREAFAAVRENTQLLTETRDEIYRHKARGEDAMAAGIALTIAEIIAGQPSGLTPASDWSDRDTELAQRFDRRYADARESLARLRQVVVGHGLTFKAPDQPTYSSDTSANAAADYGSNGM